MPNFTVSVVNESFSSSNQHDALSAEKAKAEALEAALQIGVAEVAAGKPFFAAEVKVETANQVVGRFVVSVGSSPLLMS